MSRGLGRIERAILGMIEDKDVCEERYRAVEARAIYQKPRPIQAEHVAALRAMRSLVRKFPDRFVLSCGAARGLSGLSDVETDAHASVQRSHCMRFLLSLQCALRLGRC